MDVTTNTEEILAESFIQLLELEHNVGFSGEEGRVFPPGLGG